MKPSNVLDDDVVKKTIHDELVTKRYGFYWRACILQAIMVIKS